MISVHVDIWCGLGPFGSIPINLLISNINKKKKKTN